MQPPAGGPVMAITVDAVANLQADDLGGLWTVFTKCKESLQDGRRLENISWRLWYQELSHHHHSPIVITTDQARTIPDLPPAVDSDGEATSEDSAGDDWDRATAVADVEEQLTVAQLIRPSSRGISPSPRRLHNSHPQSSTVRPIIESHRANSAPSHYRSSRKSCVNVGKIISALLPYKIPIPTVQKQACESSVQPQLSVAQPPSVVILGPTPCPTPPRTPFHSDSRTSLSPHLSIPSTSSLPPPSNPNRTITPSSSPPSVVSPRPVEEHQSSHVTAAGRKKATFFFKESPGASENLTDIAASVSTTSSGMKTPVPLPLPIDEQTPQPTQAQPSNKPLPRVSKKGKEALKHVVPTRQLSTKQIAARHHVPTRNTSINQHHRNHSTIAGNTSRHVPPRSKSSTAIAAIGGPVAIANDIQGKIRELRPPQPAPEQLAQPAVDSAVLAEPSKAMFTKTGRLEITTSSDFETTDTEGDDSSWASDFSDDEEETGHIARQAAVEAARQREMFAKVPTPSYVNLAQNRKSGLLTNLFHPDPAVVPHLPHHHPFRAHNSAQNLGSRPTATVSTTPLQTSKSSAAVPLAAQVNVTQVAVNPSGRPGYRLKGRPEGADVESSDDEDDAVPLSKSLAQRRLEALAGISRKNSRSGTSNPIIPHPNDFSQQTAEDLIPQPSVPMPLPHPYNLPAPAPPATPRTTRREMLKTEMSESLRRQILWERETNRRMMRGGVRRTGGGILNGLRPLTSTADSGPSRDDAQKRQAPAGLVRNWSSDDYHTAGW